jgi:hypothetical protein
MCVWLHHLFWIKGPSEIFLWCAKSSLERLATWHSTNSHGRFQCGPFIQSITPTKFRRSKFPGNMHNRILCPYYLPSFMKFSVMRYIVLKDLTPGIPQIVMGDFNVDLLFRKDDVITRIFSAFELICTTAYCVLTTYQVSWSSVQ